VTTPQVDARSWIHAASQWLPRGNLLRDNTWLRRHRLITRFALVQAFALGVFALVLDGDPVEALLAFAVPAVPAATALWPELSRRVRTLSTVTSLMLASITLVALSHGLTEAHFHFFFMLGVVALYQDWAAFGLCVVLTMAHHAIMGIGDPTSVFGNAYQQRNPVLWASVHGLAVLAISVTNVVAWKLNEVQELRDPLTQLPNRTSFNLALENRASGDQPLSIMFVDVDHFKNINDSNGHHVGDAALVHVASAMGDAVRNGDLISRLGGDEFAILLDADAETAFEVAQRVENTLAAPAIIEGREVFVSASIGLADDAIAGTRDPELLLRAADQAMYVAKSTGRGHTKVYSAEIDATVTRQARLTADLAAAIENGELFLAYQPIVDGATGRMHGVEALLRWQHPELGVVPPLDFIPLAEETGLILPVGAWVLREACRQVADWQENVPSLRNLTVSVNLAAQQLRDPNLLEHVAVALGDSGLPHTSLTLEVTETSMLTNLDVARRQLEAVRALGVTVAIDDFGTGYSSLSYLARLPADHVKIDRSFVSNLVGESTALALVQCIVDMAHALELDVTAEGVEEREQQQLLDDLGCRWSQGYLFSAPMSPDAIPAFAADGRPRENLTLTPAS
jgi:diguanylate cyclase